MPTHLSELTSIAVHLRTSKVGILDAWQAAVKSDPNLRVGASLSETEFLDHVPALLDTFEHELTEANQPDTSPAMREFPRIAATHGLKRWQQGYDLTELVRELGQLNECVVHAVDQYTRINRDVSHDAICAARQVWAKFHTVSVEQSVRQYALLLREEANGQVQDLETALGELKKLEAERAHLWQQAAHGLRGNVGVVANASVGLTHNTLDQPARDSFVRILIRNVSSLHQLLDDVTELARLQAGREVRKLQSIDVTPLLEELCEGIRPVASSKQLFLRTDGPSGLGVQGDPVKLRRVAQNLILNAVKFTQSGGITVSWGESRAHDERHWLLKIADTGPGFPSDSGRPIANALQGLDQPASAAPQLKVIDSGPGEGLGLAIVKRLCQILDATIERHSVPGVGTTFTILFPKSYELDQTKQEMHKAAGGLE